MKYVLPLLFVSFLVVSSCDTAVESGTIALKSRADSLSYAFGVFSVDDPNQGLKKFGITLNADKYLEGYNYIHGENLSDEDKSEAFTPLMKLSAELRERQGRPFTDVEMPTVSLDSFSFAYGAFNANTYLGCGYKVNEKAACAGIKDAYEGTAKLDGSLVNELAQAFNVGLREAQMADAQAKGEANRLEGEKFLAENQKDPDVKVTASGLQYKVLRKGSGTRYPKATSKVKVHYEGRLINGKVFDSSYKRGTPMEYNVNGFVAGWIEGLQLMQEGDKFQLYVPSELAYKERGTGADIGPNATLIFDMELLEIME